MSTRNPPDDFATPEGVQAEIQRQPHIFLRLAENTLTVAESLRDNYFANTARFIAHVRRAMLDADRSNPILTTYDLTNASWADFQDEVITLKDGGVGQVQISSQVPTEWV